MAQILGTNVAAPVVPFSTDDIYASHEAKWGKGGYRSVSTIAERDAIKELRRENLMLVAVEDSSSSGTGGNAVIYQLYLNNPNNPSSDNDLTNNDNWVPLEFGGSGDDWILPPPTSSFYPGEPGQRSYDDDFVYICIQPNLWKRISMDYFVFNASTSGAPNFTLPFGVVPVFDGDSSWNYELVVKNVFDGGTAGLGIVFTDNSTSFLDIEFGGSGDNWTLPPPISSSAPGQAGERSYDSQYLYIAVANNLWKRINLDFFVFNPSATSGTSGNIASNGEVPIYSDGGWDTGLVVQDVNSTSGGINIVYTNNTLKFINVATESSGGGDTLIGPENRIVTTNGTSGIQFTNLEAKNNTISNNITTSSIIINGGNDSTSGGYIKLFGSDESVSPNEIHIGDSTNDYHYFRNDKVSFYGLIDEVLSINSDGNIISRDGYRQGNRNLIKYFEGGSQISIGDNMNSQTDISAGNKIIAIGENALNTFNNSSSLIAIGSNSMSSYNGIVAGHIAIGENSLSNMLSGAIGNTAIGYRTGESQETGDNNTYIGNDSGRLNTGSSNTFIGSNSGINIAAPNNVVVIGNSSGYNSTSDGGGSHIILGNSNRITTSASNNIILGETTNVGFSNNIIFNMSGSSVAEPDANNQMIVVGPTVWYFGGNNFTTTGAPRAIQTPNIESGNTDVPSASLSIRTGLSTGSGNGGDIIHQISFPGSTGTSQNSYSDVWTLSTDGAVLDNLNMGINFTSPTHLLSIQGDGVNDLVIINDNSVDTILNINEDGVVNTRDGYWIGGEHFVKSIDDGVIGSHNIALGYDTFSSLTTGSNNIAIGIEALQSTSIASSNVAVGYRALSSGGDFSNNVALGQTALRRITSSANVGVGTGTAEFMTTEDKIVAIGHNALANATGFTGSSSDVIAIGYASLRGGLQVNDVISIGQNFSTVSDNYSLNSSILIGSSQIITTNDSNNVIRGSVIVGRAGLDNSSGDIEGAIVIGKNENGNYNTVNHNYTTIVNSTQTSLESSEENQIIFGNNKLFLGYSPETNLGVLEDSFISTSNRTGANQYSSNLILQTGKPSGTGGGGALIVEVGDTFGLSGSDQGTQEEVLNLGISTFTLFGYDTIPYIFNVDGSISSRILNLDTTSTGNLYISDEQISSRHRSTGTKNVVIGNATGRTTDNWTGSENTLIGTDITLTDNASNTTVVGSDITVDATRGVAIGSGTFGGNGIQLDHNDCVIIGSGSVRLQSSETNQFIVQPNKMFLGGSPEDNGANTPAVTISSLNRTGIADEGSGSLTLRTGNSTGTGEGGDVIIEVARPGAAGTTVNISEEVARFTSDGNIDCTTTDGAFIVPRVTTATRTGLTAVNGMIVYDTDLNAFYFYENGSWVTK